MRAALHNTWSNATNIVRHVYYLVCLYSQAPGARADHGAAQGGGGAGGCGAAGRPGGGAGGAGGAHTVDRSLGTVCLCYCIGMVGHTVYRVFSKRICSQGCVQ